MNEQSKYRLIGAVALIAIALILIPFFFKAKKQDSEVELAPISMEPGVTEQQKEAQPEDPSQPKEESQEQPENQSDKEEHTLSPSTPSVPNMQEESPHAQQPPSVSPSHEQPKAPVKPSVYKQPISTSQTMPSSEVASKQEPVMVSHASPSPSSSVQPLKSSNKAQLKKGWVIQVGRFSNEANAKRLVAQLRSRGFDTDIRKIVMVKSSSTRWSRVNYQVIIKPVVEQRKIAIHHLSPINQSLQSLHIKGFVIKVG